MKKLNPQIIGIATVVLILMVVFGWRNHRRERAAASSARPAAPVEQTEEMRSGANVGEQPKGWTTSVSSSAVAGFKSWAENYMGARTPESRAAMLAEGERLAKARREEMAHLIKSDPEHALAAAVPYGVRKQLPPGIVNLLEEPVSGRGDYSVTYFTPLPGREICR